MGQWGEMTVRWSVDVRREWPVADRFGWYRKDAEGSKYLVPARLDSNRI